jgi:hypothetical protein
VTVDGGGSITATTNSGAATGILAFAYGGYTSVNATGISIDATSTLGDAAGINAYGYSGVFVYNDADIFAHATSGLADGIVATANQGGSTVASDGSITVIADALAHGILATTVGGDVGVTCHRRSHQCDQRQRRRVWHRHATAGGAGVVSVDSSADIYAYATMALLPASRPIAPVEM